MKDDETVSLSVITFQDMNDRGLFLSCIPLLNIIACGESDVESREELECITRFHFKWCIEKGYDSVKDYILSYDGWTIDDLGNLVEPGEEFLLENNDMYDEIISNNDVERWVLTISI